MGLLHARLVMAHEAHAKITSIAVDEALVLPGVVAVLTAADLPLVTSGPGRLYEPLAREEVIYAGQPVALVVAESEALAEDAAELVEVELEPLETVIDLEAAARPGAPRAPRRRSRPQGDGSDIGDAHASVAAGGVGDDEELSDNVLGTARLAQRRRRRRARRQPRRRQRHASRRRGCTRATSSRRPATAWLEPDGELVVSSATQAPFATRDSLAKLFGLPVDRIRVRATTLGRCVRRQDDDRRAAGRVRGARPPPSGAAGDDPQRGHVGDQPGRRRDSVARGRR